MKVSLETLSPPGVAHLCMICSMFSLALASFLFLIWDNAAISAMKYKSKRVQVLTTFHLGLLITTCYVHLMLLTNRMTQITAMQLKVVLTNY